MTDVKPAQFEARKASFAKSMKAVLWSFFGVRKRSDLESDMALNPVHVILAGVIAAAIFVTVLITIVHKVTS